MKLTTSIVFTLAVTIFQVESYSRPHKLPVKGLDNMLKQEMLKEETGSYTSMNDIFDNVKFAMKKVKSCNLESKMELINLATDSLNSFDACINGTRKVADILKDGTKWFAFIIDERNVLYALFKAIYNCYSETGLVNIIECAISKVQESGNTVNQTLNTLGVMVLESGVDVDEFLGDVKYCFSFHHTLFLEAAMKINKC